MHQGNPVWREYRELVKSLTRLQGANQPGQNDLRDLLRSLRTGWLTPGSEILFRLEKKRLKPRAVARRPPALQRKWFQELNDLEKSRWIAVFWDTPAKSDLPKLLKLSKRRLQQLMKTRNPFRSDPS